MDFLYIPIFGAMCLVAVLCLLIISLCIHFRNADSTRIRFLKHSYRSVWLEAPGFCEIQHRNYIYSYQQSPLMACGSDAYVAKRASAGGGGEESSTAEGEDSSDADNSNGDHLIKANSLPGGRRSAVFSQRPINMVSFVVKEDEVITEAANEHAADGDEKNALITVEDLNNSNSNVVLSESLSQLRHVSFPSVTDDVFVLERKNSSGKRMQMIEQLCAAKAELATCEIGDNDYVWKSFDETSADQLAGSSSSAASRLAGVAAFRSRTTLASAPILSTRAKSPTAAPLTSQKQRIRSVLQDFYHSVQTMKLQKVEPSNESLQKLAKVYGEHGGSRGALQNYHNFWSIAEDELEGEGEEENEEESPPLITKELSETDVDWLKECVVQGSNTTRLIRPYSSHLSVVDTVNSPSPARSASSSGSLPVPRTSVVERVTLGHASGLRRFLFSGTRHHHNRNSTRREKTEKTNTKLLPRLSSSKSTSQTSV